MSLDARLKQGFPSLADAINVDAELGLVRVTAVAHQRERRNLLIMAVAGAAAALALLAAGGRLTDMVLGLEVPLPPARENKVQEDRDGDEVEIVERIRREDFTDEDFDEGGNPIVVGLGASTVEETDSFSRSSGSGQSAAREDNDSAPPANDGTETQTGSTEPRIVHRDYAGSAVPLGGGRSSCDEGDADQIGCVRLETEEGERSVEVSISDQSRGIVAAWIQVDRDGDGQADGEWTSLCSDAGPALVSIPPSGDAVVYIEINGGACDDGTESNPTSGTVTAVFAT